MRGPSSSVCSTRFQTCPAGSQKRANAHRCSASFNESIGPWMSCACSSYPSRVAVSSPSKLTLLCEPSQNGLVLDWPHRQSLKVASWSNRFPSFHSIDSPAALTSMCCSARGTLPVTTYGPFVLTAIGWPRVWLCHVLNVSSGPRCSLHHNGSPLPDVRVYQTPVLEASRFGERETERRRELPRVARREEHAGVHVAGAIVLSGCGWGDGRRVE